MTGKSWARAMMNAISPANRQVSVPSIGKRMLSLLSSGDFKRVPRATGAGPAAVQRPGGGAKIRGLWAVFGRRFDTKRVEIIYFAHNPPSCIGTLQFSLEMFVNQLGDFIAGSGPFRLGVPVLFPCEPHGTPQKVARHHELI